MSDITASEAEEVTKLCRGVSEQAWTGTEHSPAMEQWPKALWRWLEQSQRPGSLPAYLLQLFSEIKYSTNVSVLLVGV